MNKLAILICLFCIIINIINGNQEGVMISSFSLAVNVMILLDN